MGCFCGGREGREKKRGMELAKKKEERMRKKEEEKR